jgi:ferritin-like metal-binding protein YciE
MSEAITEIYVAGLINARAIETEAIQLLSRQVERLENYPEMVAALRNHIVESERQRERLDTLLTNLGTSNSVLKDMATGLAANVAALGHAMAPDEVIKNSLANYAFEHYEIAAYKSLMTLAELAGHGMAAGLLRQSLLEEERMAQWCADHLEPTTRRYVELRARGEKAGI